MPPLLKSPASDRKVGSPLEAQVVTTADDLWCVAVAPVTYPAGTTLTAEVSDSVALVDLKG